ncbi:MAG: YdcH family protein [Hahellaceae bacterium]|jgi:uncharacterized protein YdcH (DUF465 family)|nr:YdcH family protein [Hahellaceae bacterium]
MMIENHALINEFPELREKIHEMKMENNHFARLFEDYHNVDHEVHRIEQGVEVSSDEYVEGLKKSRLALKDSLYAMLTEEA